MPETLEEMKLARGGKCFNCDINIMDPIHKDHSFCNDCWIKILQHLYTLEDEGCAYCDEPEDSPLHIKSQSLDKEIAALVEDFAVDHGISYHD